MGAVQSSACCTRGRGSSRSGTWPRPRRAPGRLVPRLSRPPLQRRRVPCCEQICDGCRGESVRLRPGRVRVAEAGCFTFGTRPVANGGRPRRATPRPSALRCFRVCAEAGASGVRPNRPACGRSGPSPARGFPRRAAPREPLHFHKLASRILIAELQEIFRGETRRRRSDRDAEPRGGRVLSRPASPWSPRSAPGWWSPRQLHRDRRWPGRSPGRPRAPCSTAPGRTARPSASVPGWRR